jgi:hypothetical protein
MIDFGKIPRLDWAKKQPAPDGDEVALPDGKLVRIRRRQRMLAEASQVLGDLPGEGESLHALMTGRYDLMHLLLVLIERLGVCERMRFATLAFSQRNVTELCQLLDAGKVVTFLFADGATYSLEGSANLRSNSNREQFCLTNDKGLHDWHAAWIDEALAEHGEVHKG